MAPATANSLLLSTISLQIYILLIRTSPPDWIDRHIRCKYIFMPTKNLVPSSNLMLGFVVVVLLLTKEDTRTSEPIVVFDSASLTETARIGFWWRHWSHVLRTQALCLVLFVCVAAGLRNLEAFLLSILKHEPTLRWMTRSVLTVVTFSFLLTRGVHRPLWKMKRQR